MNVYPSTTPVLLAKTRDGGVDVDPNPQILEGFGSSAHNVTRESRDVRRLSNTQLVELSGSRNSVPVPPITLSEDIGFKSGSYGLLNLVWTRPSYSCSIITHYPHRESFYLPLDLRPLSHPSVRRGPQPGGSPLRDWWWST